MDLGTMALVIWVGCFVVVSIDAQRHARSSFFWRVASLVGGPFALVAYGIARELSVKE